MSKENFVCPVCGGTSYSKKELSGYLVESTILQKAIKHYICDSCSTVFEDPEKFSLKPENIQHRLIRFKPENIKKGRGVLYPVIEWQQIDNCSFTVSPRLMKALKVFGIPFETIDN